MAYTVNKTDGSILVTVADGTINTDRSIALFGKNYAGYGEFLNENMVYLLENGANLTSPPNPLPGELWFDLTTYVLKINVSEDDTPLFKNLGVMSSNISQPDGSTVGDFWFDPTDEQLYVHNGTKFILIGPTFTSSGGNSGAIVDIIKDNNGIDHIVVKLIVNDVLVSIVSKDPTFAPASSIPGFTSVMPGIHMASGQNFLFEGTARRALNIDDGFGGDLDVAGAIAAKVDIAGDTMTGPLLLSGVPTLNAHAATKLYVDTEVALGGGGGGSDPAKVDVAGDTMTGFLNLHDDPTSPSHAATKLYVDVAVDAIAGSSDPAKVDVAGDTMTGALILAADPTSALGAATKNYVDGIASGGNTSEFVGGTRMVFAQASAPFGWSQDVTSNDYMMRIVSDGTANTKGGTNSPIQAHTHIVNAHTHSVNSHTHATGSHTHSMSSHTHSVAGHNHSGPSHTHSVPVHAHSTYAHTLTELEMPRHQHTPLVSGNFTINGGTGWFGASAGGDFGASNLTSLTGNGHAHEHGNTANSATSNTGPAGTGNTGTNTAQTSGAPSTANTGTPSSSNTGPTTGGTGQTGGNTASGYVPKYFNVMVAVKD